MHELKDRNASYFKVFFKKRSINEVGFSNANAILMNNGRLLNVEEYCAKWPKRIILQADVTSTKAH